MATEIELINSISDFGQVSHDNDLLVISDRNSMKGHSDNYDAILKEYTDHVAKTLHTKRFMKLFFFWVAISIMIVCAIFSIICVCYTLAQSHIDIQFNVLDYIAPVLTVLVSFLTVFIVIPKVIAKYLFNSREDTAMQAIISSIQDYDKYIRSNLHR